MNSIPNEQFLMYDLQRGLYSHASDAAIKNLINNFQDKFNTIIFDPPFSIYITSVARNIHAFLSWEYNAAFVAYPRAGLDKLNKILIGYGI